MAARLEAADLPAGAMGAIVVRIGDGAILLSHQADVPMQPASTLKTLTAIVALERLGPAYRGRTELRTAGTVGNGVLAGDLVLRGGADVDLDWPAFERMLRSLRLKGIREVAGDFVVDRGFFEPARTDVGLAPFDETPEFRYNVVPDALLLNTNLVRLELASDSEGLRLATVPPLEGVEVRSAMTLIDRPCVDWEDGWKIPAVAHAADGAIRIELRGEFPRECATATEINVLDRGEFADRLFRSLWRALGGTFRGRTREGTPGEAGRVLAQHLSRPLSEVVRDVNKRSDNPVTRVMFLSLGTLAGQDAASETARRAEREVREWLARQSIDASGLVLENGSGLSRAERIRPEQLAEVLRRAHASRWAPEFLASLPIVAVDGGMRSRLRTSPAAEQARIKTGTLRDVSAVAGYVTDASGRTCVVVAMLNHPFADAKTSRPILDALLDWVARSGGS